jgi:hypothetical protein
MRKENYPYQKGDLVRCNYNFDVEREKFKLSYPKIGDYLTVATCLQHEVDYHAFLLFFEDLLFPIPLAANRFDLVQQEREGDTVLNEAWKIANNL